MATEFTVADVLAWARTKPANEFYSYSSNTSCAIAQFLAATGRAKQPSVNPFVWRDGNDGERHCYDRRISDAAHEGPDNFGSFADNLEKLAHQVQA